MVGWFGMFKYLLQIIIGLSFLVVFTFIAWYEGSTITHMSWEWKYSTPFTSYFNTEILNGNDIHQLDYFIYASKYQPLFPTLMLIMIVYILSILGLYLLKTRSKWSTIFWGLAGSILLIMCAFISIPSTTGGWILLCISGLSSIIFFGIAIGLLIFKKSVSSHKII